MDDNDLYNMLVDKGPYDHLQGLLSELELGEGALTDEERAFVRGVNANISLQMPVSQPTVAKIRGLVLELRKRLHG